MSSIPKARSSSITNLTVIPDKWDSYPNVEYSSIKASQFHDLGSSSQISRSTLDRVTITAEAPRVSGSDGRGKPRGTRIERSRLTNCAVSQSTLERSSLKDCTLESARQIERIEARGTKFIRAGKVERSDLQDSIVADKSGVERSTVKGSVIAESSAVERSQLNDVYLAKSRVERANLKDCDITECRISGKGFDGMVLKYGIWKNGDLVGRTCAKEVVMEPRLRKGDSTVMEYCVRENLARGVEASVAPTQPPPASTKDPAVPVTRADSEYSDTIDMMDRVGDFPYNSYDGPNIDLPPPYTA